MTAEKSGQMYSGAADNELETNLITARKQQSNSETHQQHQCSMDSIVRCLYQTVECISEAMSIEPTF